ncbi:TPA: transglycosylase SLT domain-containing protein [Klebsiella aerogenes]|uniref:transglycosylase SLT domain-containing protein n=1 Tax=Klebsiella aerogenes TaxID=548 RepID=UPI0028DF41C0|nr:transglycosylase SLT domain-containing protein [Klebsiella aerogenes]MDT8885967.1 transglycosylase SLT domain-containing protein [Klebsiella aerogenes]HBV9945420.1 transglycosylase SLT domain-containing protein [Klebsiella aerogenes]
MKRIAAILMAFFFSGSLHAADCFELAGRDYKIDPDLLRAISWNESNFRVNVKGYNPVSGFGSGLMQVDSQHFNELARYGITPQQLLEDPCMNIYTGAYYLAIAFKKWGINWQAVGAYNAGFKQSDTQALRRYSYATKIEATYKAIKENRKRERNATR